MSARAVKPWLLVAPATALLAWGGNHFTPLLLMYRQVDGYSSVEVDLFLAFYILGLVPGFLIGGPLADRYGRKRVMASGIVLSAIGSAVLAAGAASAFWLCAGRLVVGVSVAVAMVAGTSWIEELSQQPHESTRSAVRGARRGALALTAGFGLGAGASGALAQWAPAPTVLPYLLQIALLLAAAVPLAWAPETRPALAAAPRRSLAADLRIPPAARARFLRVVVPSAPWVFSALALAYVLIPALVGPRVGDDRVAFATLLTVVALGTGALVQPLAARIGVLTDGRQLLVGLGLTLLGVVLCALEAALLSPELAVAIAVVLGLGYGISIVAGLTEVQRMAGPEDLAGLTGIYCSLTYVGFLLPVVLASLAGAASYVALLIIVAGACLACLLLAGWNLRGREVAALA